MSLSLGGSIPIRNGLRLDYCFKEAIESLLPICKEVHVSDCQSDDGTLEYLRAWQGREPKLKVSTYEWNDPRADNEWFPKWLNHARKQLTTEYAIHLDADEVLHQSDHQHVEKVVRDGTIANCLRLNFWRDHKHLIPDGVCCGRKVLRIAPTNVEIPSDYPYGPAEFAMRAAIDAPVRIMHYGFLRKREAFFEKAKAVQRIWADSYDPRLEAADKAGGNWMEHDGVVPWKDQLDEYNGTHPEVIKLWLSERGYDPN